MTKLLNHAWTQAIKRIVVTTTIRSQEAVPNLFQNGFAEIVYTFLAFCYDLEMRIENLPLSICVKAYNQLLSNDHSLCHSIVISNACLECIFAASLFRIASFAFPIGGFLI